MKHLQITCDACGADLTTTGNCEDWRILLTSEPIPSSGMSVTAMAIYPPIEKPRHFCGMKCLRDSLTETKQTP